MNIIVDLQAENYFYKNLHEHECGVHDDGQSPKAGFFFSKQENTYVVFDKEFEVKLVDTISECFKFLKNK